MLIPELQAVAGTRKIRYEDAAGLRLRDPVEEHARDPDVVVEPFEVPHVRGRGGDDGGA